jgi:DNA-directed RNA polymerase subunit M
MFCPKCKALMYPKGNLIVCNKCGYEKKKSKSTIVISKQKKKDVTIIEEKDKTIVLPKTRIKCQKCGNKEAYWVLRQMRGSDEPESRFYTCTKCGNKWREG